jgi:hypothetical protein
VIPLELKALENVLSDNWLRRRIELFPGGNNPNPCYKTNEEFTKKMMNFIKKKREHSKTRRNNYQPLELGVDLDAFRQQGGKCDFIKVECSG